MSISLLDVLSNGLAAAIVLLVIGLSASALDSENRTSAAYYEVRLHYECEFGDSIVVNGSIRKPSFGGWSRERYENDLALRSVVVFDSVAIDSCVDIRRFLPRTVDEEVRPDLNAIHTCQTLTVSMSPRLGAMYGDGNVSFAVHNNISEAVDSLYVVEYRVITGTEEREPVFVKSGPLKGRVSLKLHFGESTRVTIES